METIRWLIGIVLAFAAVGLGLFYQGEALLKPEESKNIGKKMRTAGLWWIGIAIFYLIVVIVLQILGIK